MQQTGIDFFDRRFTYQVSKLVGRPLRQVNGLPVMVVGGSEDIANYEGLQIRSYKVTELDEINKKTWKTLTE